MKLQTPKIFAEKIFYYESVISIPTELVYLIESTDGELSDSSLISKWHTWTSSDDSYVFGKRKKTEISAYDSASPKVRNAYDILVKALSDYGADYANSLGIELGTQKAISISKYFTGTSMGKHVDSSPEPTTENISAVLYLNDNYSGGEISFPDQGITIKPSAGSLVIFPSTAPFYHESMPIVNGVKYMSPAFWHLEK
jgi:predicted 2-oxoglutarate/Fe(II)-dependent dioxygenase YbiX